MCVCWGGGGVGEDDVFGPGYFCQSRCGPVFLFVYIYMFIAIALDESIFLDVLNFPMKNIKSRDLEATPNRHGVKREI